MTPDGDGHYLDQDKLESLAIIGLSLKFPQDATSPDSFWKMLMEGRCAMGEVPEDRWNLASFYHPDAKRRDTIPLRGGHFIKENIAAFDAPFFSISPTEAEALDPQQRLLLETSYRALENAGLPLEKVMGSKTSVFTGSFTNDYLHLNTKDTERGSTYDVVGLSSFAMLANRLSWFYNFSGPSVNLDSACSSSLMALDMACQSLREGGADMSLVSGCNLIFNPDWMLLLSNMSFLSHDSRCFSFDHRGNGYARGDGCSVVVIKRLSDAVRDGDIIRAVIRSTGSNQDGRTPGITQPDQNAQESLIRETYEKAGLDMSCTRYFEAHGTGTAIGDPIEARALGRAFRKYRTARDPLYVGAVKSNIGHLEGASGVAGLVKTVLVLERGIIPPNTNFEKLNPNIDSEFLKIKFPLEATPWPGHGLRRASVNSFGFGGANAHVILDDACHYLSSHNIIGRHCTVEHSPSQHSIARDSSNGMYKASVNGHASVSGHAFSGYQGASPTLSSESPDSHTKENLSTHSPPKVLVWSTADEGGSKRLSTIYGQHFARLALTPEEAEKYMQDLAYTLSVRRSLLPWRSFAVASSLEQLHDMQAKLSKPVRAVTNPKLGFVFTGQGAQWAVMGRELMSFPVFRNSIDEAENNLHGFGCQWSLTEELFRNKATSKVDRPEFSQPLCTALQIAMVNLLRSFDVYPSVVIGHSSGEIAAAYTIGALSSLSACKVAYYRGLLATTLVKSEGSRGAMAAIALSESQMLPYLDEVALHFGERDLYVACINSPKNITISGGDVRVNYLQQVLERKSIFTRKLKVDVAYHSPRMNAISTDYLALIQDLEHGEPAPRSATFISTVTGTRLSAPELRQGEYWCKNMVSPVKFAEALGCIHFRPVKSLVKKLNGSHKNIATAHDLLEIGPHSALQTPIQDTIRTKPRGTDVGYTSILRRNLSALDTFLEMVGRLHCSGHSVNLNRLNGIHEDSSRRLAALTDLPDYAFDHSQTYWHESRTSKGFRFRKAPRLDLLGSPVSDWNASEARWRNVIKASEMPWIEDHRIDGSLLYPAAGMLVMAIEAANQMSDKSRSVRGFKITNASFLAALKVTLDPAGVETMFYLRPVREAIEGNYTSMDFKVCVYVRGQWTENCRGTIKIVYQEEPGEIDRGNEAAEEIRHYQQIYEGATLSCTQNINSKLFYGRLQKIGYGYGPTFQLLKAVRFNDDGMAAADVEISQANASTAHAHVVHPTTLDAMMQLVFATLTKGTDAISTMIPTHIRDMWISSSGLQDPGDGIVKAVSTSKPRGFRGIGACTSVMDETRGKLLLQMDGLEMTIVSSHEVSALHGLETTQLCSHLERKPTIELSAPSQILQYCERSQENGVDPADFFEDLTLLLLMFISKTLESIATEKPRNLSPHYQKYIEWMKLQLEKFLKGQLPHSHPEWKGSLQDAERYETLCRQVSKANKQGKLFAAVGENLVHILGGVVDPLDLLFKGDLASDFYEELYSSSNCLPAFCHYLDALAHTNPNMRILEIGAGTGSMTGSVLTTLTHNGDMEGTSRFDRYDFTDISPSFFETAHKTFTDHRRVHFKTLDIEKDPATQGFEAGTYDMIIASNVLHATSNLSVTVANARKLLKPGGKLALYEITEPQILRSGFIFGLLSGWWLSSEDYRQWSPCMSIESWHGLLSQQGFSGTELVFRDFQSDSCHELSIIISTAIIEPKQSASPLYLPKTMIVTEGRMAEESTAQQLGFQLQSLGVSDCSILPLHQTASISDLGKVFCIVLCELERPLLLNLQSEEYYNIRRLLTSAGGILWVTKGGGASGAPELRMIDGLARVLRTESDENPLVTLAIDANGTSNKKHVQNILKVFMSAAANSANTEYEPAYTEVDGLLYVDRIIEGGEVNQKILRRTLPEHSTIQNFMGGPPLEICVKSPGLLDSLCWIEDTVYALPLAPDEVEVEVKAVGLNFMDCLAALGQVPFRKFGSECAGFVTRVGQTCDFRLGERVCVAKLDAYRSFVRAPSQNVVRIPHGLPMVEAAALPVVCITAYYSLHNVARIKRSETVLIHSGAGGTGQAAIQVAQHFGAEVFTTVGSNKKRKLLMDLYGIPEDHILYSRDTTFAQGIKRMTKGKGVDVILNSLSGDSLVASWECIAPYGRFLEIGKKDIFSHQRLPMFHFAKNVTFSAVDIASMEIERPWLVQETLKSILDLVTAKKLRAAHPLHVYKVSEIVKAFQFMQSGQNDGKIVLEVKKEDPVPTILKTKPSFYFEAEKTYIIGGGLGGLGRSIAQWMISRGAKNLILLSRSGARDPKTIAFLRTLEAEGLRVETPACDMADASALKLVLDHYAKTMPPVMGCIQASMVLRDAVFANMSYEDWRAGTNAKTHSSWNLHTLLPKNMDFFVLLSSISGITGQGGQANYAAGNTYKDALAHYRITQGEKAVSIDLGVMVSEGFLAENDFLMHRMMDSGLYVPLKSTQLFALLDYYCDPALDVLTTQTCQVVVGIETPARLHAKGLDEAPWMTKPLFRHMYQVHGDTALAPETSKDFVDYRTLFAGAASITEAGSIALQALIKKLSQTLSTPSEGIDPDKPVHSFGVDSLLAIELRTWIAKEFSAEMAVFEILGGATPTGMGMTIARNSRLMQEVQ